MNKLLKHLIDSDFADLAGSRIEGRIALTDEVVNLGLHEMLAKFGPSASPENDAPASAAPDATATEKPEAMPDPKLVLQKIKVEHLRYLTEDGRTILEIKAGL